VTNFTNWLTENFTYITNGIADWFSDHFLNIIITIIIGILIAKIGAKILHVIVHLFVRAAHSHDWSKKDIHKRSCTLSALAAAIWKCLVIVITLITVSESIFPAVSFSALVASLGVVGVAIGFGSQTLVRDFLSGIFIITENQYRVGDIIELNGNSTGKVERLGARSTTIRDLEGNIHFVPNGAINRVINKTMGYSNCHFDIRISYDSDIKEAMKIINRVGQKLAKDPEWEKKITDPPRVERVSDFTGPNVTISIIGGTVPSEQWNVASEMRIRLISELKKHEIKV